MPKKVYKRKTYKPKRKMNGMDTSNKMKVRENRFKQINKYNVKPEPYPRVLYTRAKFSDRQQLTPGAGTGANSRVYRMNTIYDPYFSAGGQTVVGHANFANQYQAFLVTGAKVRVSFNNPTVDGTRIGVRLRINGNSPTSGRLIQELTEQPLTYMQGLNNSGKQEKTFNFFIRPWTLMGLSKLEYMANTTRYASFNMNSNPINVNDSAVIDVFAVNDDLAATVNYTITVVYYVQLFNRRQLFSSIVSP